MSWVETYRYSKQKKLNLINGTQNRHVNVVQTIIKIFKFIWIQYKRKLVTLKESMISNYYKNHLDKLVSDEAKTWAYNFKLNLDLIVEFSNLKS